MVCFTAISEVDCGNEDAGYCEEDEESEDEETVERSVEEGCPFQPSRSRIPGGQKHSTKPVKKRVWTVEEKAAVHRHLAKYFKEGTLPGKKAILSCMKAEPVLSQRKWQNIKDFIRNTNNKKGRHI